MAALVSLFFLGACVQPPATTAIQATIETTWEYIPILNVSEHKVELTTGNKRVARYDLLLDIGKAYPSELSAAQGKAEGMILRDARAKQMTVIAKDASGRELGRRSYALQSQEEAFAGLASRDLLKPAGVYLKEKATGNWEVYTMAYIMRETNPAPINQIWTKLQDTANYDGYMVRDGGVDEPRWKDWPTYSSSKGKAPWNTSGFWTTVLPPSVTAVVDVESGSNFNPHTGEWSAGNATIQDIYFVTSKIIRVVIANPGLIDFTNSHFKIYINDPTKTTPIVFTMVNESQQGAEHDLRLSTASMILNDEVIVVGQSTLAGEAQKTYIRSMEEIVEAVLDGLAEENEGSMMSALEDLYDYQPVSSRPFTGLATNPDAKAEISAIYYSLFKGKTYTGTIPEQFQAMKTDLLTARGIWNTLMGDINGSLLAATMMPALQRVAVVFGGGTLVMGSTTYVFQGAPLMMLTDPFQFAFTMVDNAKAQEILERRNYVYIPPDFDPAGFPNLKAVGTFPREIIKAVSTASAPNPPTLVKGRVYFADGTTYQVENDILGFWFANPAIQGALKRFINGQQVMVKVALNPEGRIHRLVSIYLPAGDYSAWAGDMGVLTAQQANRYVEVIGGYGTPNGITRFNANTAPAPVLPFTGYVAFAAPADGWVFRNLYFGNDPTVVAAPGVVQIDAPNAFLRNCSFNEDVAGGAVTIDPLSVGINFTFDQVSYNCPGAGDEMTIPGGMLGTRIRNSYVTNLVTQVPGALESDALVVENTEITGTIDETFGPAQYTKFINVLFSNPAGLAIPATGDFLDTLFEGCTFVGPVTFPAFSANQNLTFRGSVLEDNITTNDAGGVGADLLFEGGTVFKKNILSVPGGGAPFRMIGCEVQGHISGSGSPLAPVLPSAPFTGPLFFENVTFNPAINQIVRSSCENLELNSAVFKGSGHTTVILEDSRPGNPRMILKGSIVGQQSNRPILELISNTPGGSSRFDFRSNLRLHFLELRPEVRTPTPLVTGNTVTGMVWDDVFVNILDPLLINLGNAATFNSPGAIYNDLLVKGFVAVDARTGEGQNAIFNGGHFNTGAGTMTPAANFTELRGSSGVNTGLRFNGTRFQGSVDVPVANPVRDVWFNGARFDADQDSVTAVAGNTFGAQFGSSKFIGGTQFRNHVRFNNANLEVNYVKFINAISPSQLMGVNVDAPNHNLRDLRFTPQNQNMEFWANANNIMVTDITVLGTTNTMQFLVLPTAVLPANVLKVEGDIKNRRDIDFPVQQPQVGLPQVGIIEASTGNTVFAVGNLNVGGNPWPTNVVPIP